MGLKRDSSFFEKLRISFVNLNYIVLVFSWRTIKFSKSFTSNCSFSFKREKSTGGGWLVEIGVGISVMVTNSWRVFEINI